MSEDSFLIGYKKRSRYSVPSSGIESSQVEGAGRQPGKAGKKKKRKREIRSWNKPRQSQRGVGRFSFFFSSSSKPPEPVRKDCGWPEDILPELDVLFSLVF